MCRFASEELRFGGPNGSDWMPCIDSDTLAIVTRSPFCTLVREGKLVTAIATRCHVTVTVTATFSLSHPFPLPIRVASLVTTFFFAAAEATVNVMGELISV